MQEVDAARDNIDKLVAEVRQAAGNIEELEGHISIALAEHDERDKVEQELREALGQKDQEIAKREQVLGQEIKQLHEQQVELQRLKSLLWVRFCKVIGLLGKE